MVPHGSVAVDGVSLTVNDLPRFRNALQLSLIDYTLRHTTLGALAPAIACTSRPTCSGSTCSVCSRNPTWLFGTIEQAIAAIRAGKFIIVADDEDRENEGDLICAAELITPEMVNFMIKKAGGLICLALTGDRVDELDLAADGRDEPRRATARRTR